MIVHIIRRLISFSRFSINKHPFFFAPHHRHLGAVSGIYTLFDNSSYSWIFSFLSHSRWQCEAHKKNTLSQEKEIIVKIRNIFNRFNSHDTVNGSVIVLRLKLRIVKLWLKKETIFWSTGMTIEEECKLYMQIHNVKRGQDIFKLS